MTDYIEKIAKKDKIERFKAITDVLEENGIAYKVQPVPYTNALGNIIVSLNPGSDAGKTVVSAHYDNYPGTPGANDNAAACSILLNLILNIKNRGTTKDLEFVFFDLEEKGYVGSNYYLEENKERIEVVYNLDMCGQGSNILVSLSNDADRFVPGNDEEIIRLNRLPGGDADTFISAEIPTVYIVNSSDNDLDWFRNYSIGKVNCFRMPEFGMTMHRWDDTPDKCNLIQVEKIHDFVLGCLT